MTSMSGLLGCWLAIVCAAPQNVPAAASAAAPETRKGAKATSVTWVGHAAWLIHTPGGAHIAIDPWFDNPKAPRGFKAPSALDTILITHGHFDHVGNAAALAKTTGASVIGSYELISQLGLPEAKSIGGNAGGTFRVKDVTIHLVQAVHSSGMGSAPDLLSMQGRPWVSWWRWMVVPYFTMQATRMFLRA